MTSLRVNRNAPPPSLVSKPVCLICFLALLEFCGFLPPSKAFLDLFGMIFSKLLKQLPGLPPTSCFSFPTMAPRANGLPGFAFLVIFYFGPYLRAF